MIYTDKKIIDWDILKKINPKFPYIIEELEYKPLQTWVLYEKVLKGEYNEELKEYETEITTPILGLFFNYESADQTVIEHFIIPFRAYHENNYIDGAYGKTEEELKKLKYKNVTLNTSPEPLMDYIDNWNDYKYVLGIWYHKPSWKEMIKTIRNKSIYYNYE